jgi:RNA polymerase-interacting CarD/CdnL/TRCF family regulator
MEHKPGDYVVHPHHGVGQITAIEEMEFVAAEKADFYRVDFEKTTIWVKVHFDGAIRPMISKSDLSRYCQILESPPVPLAREFNLRQNELEKRLQTLTFQMLCEIVRDLNGLSGEKALNNYEKNIFQRTSRSLNQEWAISSGATLDEATRLIQKMLEKGRQK